MSTTKNKQSKISTFRMGLFTTSKLVQNLGFRNEVYTFDVFLEVLTAEINLFRRFSF